MKKKITIVGGGNGTAIGICALKKFNDRYDLSAVVSVVDSGGSTGRLRQEFGVLPPGDLMRGVLAMSPYDYHTLRQIFYKNRFKDTGKLDKHNLGNLFLTLSAQYAGDFLAALRALSQAVQACGPVYPVSLDNLTLCVRLTDGTVVKTEALIDEPRYDRSLKIKEAWLEPAGKVYEPAARVLGRADYIVFVLGSLYTSVIPNLLVGGVKEVLSRSTAKIVTVVGNAYEARGETGPTTLSGMITHLERYLPRPIDVIVCNNAKLNQQQKSRYQEKNWALFDQDVDMITAPRRCAQDNFEKEEGGLDAEKLGTVLAKIIV